MHCLCVEGILNCLCDKMPVMTALLSESCVHLTEQSSNSQCRLPSISRPCSLLPNRPRHAVNAELRSHSAGVSTKQSSAYYEVLTRPAVLSRRQRCTYCTTTSNDVYWVNKPCGNASVLQSPSDSNVLARSGTLRTDTLKTAGVELEQELHGNVFQARKVGLGGKKSDGAVPSRVVSHQEDCHRGTEDRAKTKQRQTWSAGHTNSGTWTHVSSEDRSHLESSRNNKDHSKLQNILGRRLSTVNGGRLHLRTIKHQTNNYIEPMDSRSLAQAEDEEEFLENLRKSYSRLMKAKSRSKSGHVRRCRKMPSSSGEDESTAAELCVVGQSFITDPAISTTHRSNENKDRPISRRQKVNSASRPQSNQLQVNVISEPRLCVQQTDGAPVENEHCSKEAIFVPTMVQLCGGVDVVTGRRTTGKTSFNIVLAQQPVHS